MWQNATKGRGEWTGLSLRRISMPVSFYQRRARQKEEPWFDCLLGNWGSNVWNVHPTLHVYWPQVTQFVFFFLRASIMNFLFERKKKWWVALGRGQQTHILSVPVKLLSNCCRAAGGADICFSLAAGCRPCRSQSPGMPHTFCLFYMSKQIVNWLIIFVLTMSFTAVSLLSALFALFKYEPSGPPFRCALLH